MAYPEATKFSEMLAKTAGVTWPGIWQQGQSLGREAKTVYENIFDWKKL